MEHTDTQRRVEVGATGLGKTRAHNFWKQMSRLTQDGENANTYMASIKSLRTFWNDKYSTDEDIVRQQLPWQVEEWTVT